MSQCKCCTIKLTDLNRNDCYEEELDYCKDCVPSPDYSNVNSVEQCCYDKLTKKFDVYWEFIHKKKVLKQYKKWKKTESTIAI